MWLTFENANFTSYLHKQATSRITASQLTQIPLASKPIYLENVHSKQNLYKSLSVAGNTFALEEQERGYCKSLCGLPFSAEITNR